MFYLTKTYNQCLEYLVNQCTVLNELKNKSILVTGATGLIGSYLIDLLMKKNEIDNSNIKIFASGRSLDTLNSRFRAYKKNYLFEAIQIDIMYPISAIDGVNYIIHGASNANPALFSKDPVGTILGNTIGLRNVLDFSLKVNANRLLYISTGEVYGEVEANIESFRETDSGYVNNLDVRSCYPNSKRNGETLCVAYNKQFGVSTIIARPCHIYGPTSYVKDNRAATQFLLKAAAGKEIKMNSTGAQLRSYCFVGDCVTALLYILLFGSDASAYNISNSSSNVTIKEFAKKTAQISKVPLDVPQFNSDESILNNIISRAVLNSDKIEALGWRPSFNLDRGISETIKCLREQKNL